MANRAVSDEQIQLAREIADYCDDPARFAREQYPWKPRKWQHEILDCIGTHLRTKRFTPLQIAVASGHGIGKSALVSMIIGWAMSTCEDCKVVLTANTFDQLRTKTWPEVNKWLKACPTYKAGWWTATATAITSRFPSRDRTWRADAISWSENNTEAFAGLHNQGKRIVLIFDEASAIADKVWQVAEGAMTDEETEIIWLAFGNPTKNTGRFRECFGALAHRWKTFQIDSRRVEGTNKQQIAQWAEDYGEDSDWFRVRVRGEFPRAGTNQLIPSDVVAVARKFKASGYEHMPKIGSCDVARFGDDRTVIGDRQGRLARIICKYRGLDIVQTGERCIDYIENEKPDAFVIDGDGLGAGVFDYVKHRGYDSKTLLVEFHGGAESSDQHRFFNKRAEMWWATRDWLTAGAQIPDDPELDTDLTSPTYDTANGKRLNGSMILESKDDMKKRGLSSPDCGDMLAMTFAVKVVPKPTLVTQPVYYGESSWMA